MEEIESIRIKIILEQIQQLKKITPNNYDLYKKIQRELEDLVFP